MFAGPEGLRSSRWQPLARFADRPGSDKRSTGLHHC
jgi:hypothetical protein